MIQGLRPEITRFPVKFPDNRELALGDGFAHDCAHHQAFQALSHLGHRENSRVLQVILQSCSLLELQHRRFRELNIAVEIVGIEDRFDVLETMARAGTQHAYAERDRHQLVPGRPLADPRRRLRDCGPIRRVASSTTCTAANCISIRSPRGVVERAPLAPRAKAITESHDQAMPRGTVSHYSRAAMARAMPLDSARIVMWNIAAKMHMAG